MNQPEDRSRRRFIKASSMLGMAVAFSPATIGEAFAHSKSRTTKEDDTMNQPTVRQRSSEQAADATTIRPFHVSFPETDLTDLRRRIKSTRWPERETVNDESQGVQFATTQKLARYWGTDYDWRKAEARINAVPNFITNIDGLDIHFIHVRSKEKNALPVIITHGWPGSIIEQMKIIGPLTDSVAYGGKPEDAFDVVIPSLPGYGFSGKPTATGWDPQRVARSWAVLMNRLGYTRYVAQGGDWGNAVTEQMALQQPAGLIGIHTNMPATVPAEISKAMAAGSGPPATLSADERKAWDQLDFFYKTGLGYANEMALRPQTLYAIADSPVGLAAWMIDHDDRSYKLIARVFDGKIEGLTRDRHPRQRYVVLVDEYGSLFGPSVLGKQARFLRTKRCSDPCGRERLSR
jgi:pimeloyl-ACP methyl ester carboxylesterase